MAAFCVALSFFLVSAASAAPGGGGSSYSVNVAGVPFGLNFGSAAAAPKRVQCPDGQMDDERCCVFHTMRDDMQQNLFLNSCANGVPDVLRLAFHDAISYSRTQNAGGGADGSMIVFPVETTYAENVGLSSVADDLSPYITKYNVSAGDVVQFAAMVGTSNCPGSPTNFKFLAGRPPPKAAAPDGFVPGATDGVTKILQRMGDAGFQPQELVALLASHSVGRADTVDPAIPGAAFDSTPTALDGQFYLEVLFKPNGWPGTQNIDPSSGEVMSGMAPQGEIRLASDSVIARDPRTSCYWQSYINNQGKLSRDFGAGMFKVSMLGQNQHFGQMYDCSGALPKPTPPQFGKQASYPGGYSVQVVERSCFHPFPKLQSDPGVAPTIPPDADVAGANPN